MSPVKIEMYYEADASENVMNRLFNPRTRRVTRGLRRNAKFWRDHLIKELEQYRGQFGDDVQITLQVVSDGTVRGDSANFVKLATDAIAKGLGLSSDCRVDVHALPRTTVRKADHSSIHIVLKNPGEEQTDAMSEM